MAATNFPFSLANIASLKNSSGNIPRFNMKNDGIYSIGSGLGINGPIAVQGYSSTIGDKGKAIIDATGVNATIITVGTTTVQLIDLISQNNAAGTGDAFQTSSSQGIFLRCVANNVRGNGFNIAGTGVYLVECEAYSCNKANSSTTAGFNITSNCLVVNCVSHDNTGSNTDGFFMPTSIGTFFINCISDSNGRCGFAGAPGNGAPIAIHGCNIYNNGSDGIRNTNTTANSYWLIRNSNFVKNGGWGVNSTLTTGSFFGVMDNCGFGSGTQQNTSGTTNGVPMLLIDGSITYPNDATPWVDAANGDWRTNLSEARGTGHGQFTLTQSGYGNASVVGYPDIGAVQHYDTQKASTFGG